MSEGGAGLSVVAAGSSEDHVAAGSALHLGRDVLVGRHVTLSVGYGPGDPGAPARGLVIGDRCVIGARSSLTAHESIELGDDVWFGQDVFVCDASHGYQLPDHPIGHQFGPHAPVRIGSGSWIGHGAIVLPGTTLGRNVVVGDGAVVRDGAVVGDNVEIEAGNILAGGVRVAPNVRLTLGAIRF